jgi:hypothetical protein
MMAEDSNGLSLLKNTPYQKILLKKSQKQKMKHHDKSSLLLLLRKSPTKQKKILLRFFLVVVKLTSLNLFLIQIHHCSLHKKSKTFLFLFSWMKNTQKLRSLEENKFQYWEIDYKFLTRKII